MIKQPCEPIPVTYTPGAHGPDAIVEFTVACEASIAERSTFWRQLIPGACNVRYRQWLYFSTVCSRSTILLVVTVVRDVSSPLLQVRDEFLNRSRVPHPLQCPFQKLDSRTSFAFPQLPQQLFLERRRRSLDPPAELICS